MEDYSTMSSLFSRAYIRNVASQPAHHIVPAGVDVVVCHADQPRPGLLSTVSTVYCLLCLLSTVPAGVDVVVCHADQPGPGLLVYCLLSPVYCLLLKMTHLKFEEPGPAVGSLKGFAPSSVEILGLLRNLFPGELLGEYLRHVVG